MWKNCFEAVMEGLIPTPVRRRPRSGSSAQESVVSILSQETMRYSRASHAPLEAVTSVSYGSIQAMLGGITFRGFSTQ